MTGKEKMVAPIEATNASIQPVQSVQPENTPQIVITADDLMYLYGILMQANVPSREAKYVVGLQDKLQAVLEIQKQQGRN